MICESCEADRCDACTGTLTQGDAELPCGCPDARHNSPRKTRSFSDEIPHVPTIVLVGGDLQATTSPDEQETTYWRAVAEMYKVRYDAAREASSKHRDKAAKLGVKVEKLQKRLARHELPG